MTLHLISHDLCPYVQRAVIALREKSVPFRRSDIDLADKPDWFVALSPLGKTPVLEVNDTAVFESAVIVEYLEDSQPNPLHPDDPLQRARHRAWIEVASATLADIAAFYAARDAEAFELACARLRERFIRLEAELGDGPWFAGGRFGLVDAAFGPVFRYFDSFDRIADFGILDGLGAVAAWRQALAARPSVAGAVPPDYPYRLTRFLLRRDSHLSRLIRQSGTG